MIAIQTISLPLPGFDILEREAQQEGHAFVATLAEEWKTAQNRFDAPGETLCGYLDEGKLTAVGGLNCDPFAGRPEMGRIRKVYVRPAWRGKGIGEALVRHLVAQARLHFQCVRLRAANDDAARLYERIGFVPMEGEGPDATHILQF